MNQIQEGGTNIPKEMLLKLMNPKKVKKAIKDADYAVALQAQKDGLRPLTKGEQRLIESRGNETSVSKNSDVEKNYLHSNAYESAPSIGHEHGVNNNGMNIKSHNMANPYNDYPIQAYPPTRQVGQTMNESYNSNLVTVDLDTLKNMVNEMVNEKLIKHFLNESAKDTTEEAVKTTIKLIKEGKIKIKR
jgi:hypothetical protein